MSIIWSIVWSILWGLMTLTIMILTIKYYLPKLESRVKGVGSETHSGKHLELKEKNTKDDKLTKSRSSDYNIKKLIKGEPHRRFLIIVLCFIFATLCGYVASVNTSSLLYFLKVMLTFNVLACVFITDIELKVIPNMCSLVLIVARIITILIEFIWIKEYANEWLKNSIIALIVSFIFLIVISLISKGGIGEGDIKLLSSIGFLCGIRAGFYTLFFAFFTCAIVSTVLIISRKKQHKDTISLGPFIWLGFGITVLLTIY